MNRPAITGILALTLLAAAPGRAEVRSGSCQLTTMGNHVLAPVNLTFPIDPGSARARVTVDTANGRFSLDGSSLSIAPYNMPFSQARDIIDFADQTFDGTIDSSGTVTLRSVKFKICTLGIPEGTDCVPSNLCSNDTSRICIVTADGGVGCDGGGICQGVCSNDQARTCAGAADCPGGTCGTGFLVPFNLDLSTGTSTFGDVMVQGVPLDFTTHALTLAGVKNTPPESPIIGDTGISSIFMSCVLDVPLPGPPALAVKNGQVHLGKGGASVADDALGLKASFSVPGGIDFDAQDLVLTLGTATGTVVSLRIPAGSLKANRKQTVFTLRDKSGTVVVSPPGGVTPVHQIKIVHKGAVEYVIKLASKKLKLDALAGDQVVTSVTAGYPSASTTLQTRTKARALLFP